MSGRPPIYPLFPYTTLFRSLSGGVDSSLIVGLLAEAGQHGLATFSIGFESVGGVKGDEFKRSESTRLNSSHVETSYAGFCLKKKKTLMQPVIGQKGICVIHT